MKVKTASHAPFNTVGTNDSNEAVHIPKESSG